VQIRSHAQKYFLKVQKNDTGERVPPPRPKRRSSQPYPQKASAPGLPGAPPAPSHARRRTRADGVTSSRVPSYTWGFWAPLLAYR
jgi:hypothetical protein